MQYHTAFPGADLWWAGVMARYRARRDPRSSHRAAANKTNQQSQGLFDPRPITRLRFLFTRGLDSGFRTSNRRVSKRGRGCIRNILKSRKWASDHPKFTHRTTALLAEARRPTLPPRLVACSVSPRLQPPPTGAATTTLTPEPQLFYRACPLDLEEV